MIVIVLNTIEDVKEFVEAANQCNYRITLSKGVSTTESKLQYIVDAKSILGVLSLDLTTPCNLNLYCDEKNILDETKKFLKWIK